VLLLLLECELFDELPECELLPLECGPLLLPPPPECELPPPPECELPPPPECGPPDGLPE
jgi:hypothetical protein